MKSRSIPMGSIPCCLVRGHRSLTFRFAHAAHSWALSPNVGGIECRLPARSVRIGVRYAAAAATDGRVRHRWGELLDGIATKKKKKMPWEIPIQARSWISFTEQPLQLQQFPSPNPIGRICSSSLVSTSTRNLATVGRNARRKQSAGKKAETLQSGDMKFIDWWAERMKQCQKPSTRELIKRVVFDNLLGLDSKLSHGNLKEGGLPFETLGYKRRFPYEVILTRVGEFYECSGFDACVLVEYAGLNPMGGLTNPSCVPRAGCPIANLRQTLDALTSSGFSVCIVEEVKGPSNAKGRKDRFISGHAHPGSPYVYGLAESNLDVEFPDPVAIVGISRSASGYCLISVVELMRTYSVEEQLTEEAVVAKLRAKPFQKLFLHRSLRDNSTETVRWGEFGDGGLLWAECRGQNSEWYDSNPVSELLSEVRDMFHILEDAEDEAGFRRIVPPPGDRPRPLNIGTASQVGILPTHGVPSLLKVILPPRIDGLCLAYFRDLLLNPPPDNVASYIQTALRTMSEIKYSIPDFTCVSAAKLVKLIEAKEANHLEFARIKDMAEDVLMMEKDPQLSVLLGLLLQPTWLAAGLPFEQDKLVDDCQFLVRRLDEVLAPAEDPLNAISRNRLVRDEFFNDMECRWKGRVRRVHVEKAYSNVDRAVASLCDALDEDFQPIVLRTKGLAAPLGGGGAGGTSAEIEHNQANRSIWLKGKRFRPTVWSGGPGEEEIKRLKEAKDGKGKKAGDDWFTTDRVEMALEYYRCAVERASSAVFELLKDVSEELKCKLNAIVFVANLSIVAKTLFAHASEAKRRRWVVPTLLHHHVSEDRQGQGGDLMKHADGGKNRGHKGSLYLEDMFPYWLDKTQDQVVVNTIKLESMFLLTGPNGGGKSSILRSICATTLLAICGLMVPARKAVVPPLDCIMLRMMISDSPADCKSSFQMEMSELRTILSEATGNSLVLVDELCKGTEVNKGTFIVASVLEHLDHLGCLGVISTHFHGLLDMDLDVQNVVRKAMGVKMVDARPIPTWRLVDGECRESLAFETARREGVPESVLQRAEEFYQEWKKTLDAGRLVENSNDFGKAVYSNDLNTPNLQVDNQLFAIREPLKSIDCDPGPDPEIEILGGSQVLDSPKYFTGNRTDSQLWCSSANGAPSAKYLSVQSRIVPLSPQIKKSTGEYGKAFDDLQPVVLRICEKKLSELYKVQRSGKEVTCECIVIGPRQKPPPMTTNHACLYILKWPDGRFYVGQTDNMAGRMERHRSMPGLHDAPFLYIPLHNKSVACELETCIINQLPLLGFSVVNKADQNHRYFGTASLTYSTGETPPF